MDRLAHPADAVVTGIFQNRATMQTQVYLDGRLIGCCDVGLPREAQQEWLRQVLSGLTFTELAKVLTERQSDGRDA